MRGDSFAILAYHHVGFPPVGASPLTVTPRSFERQIRWLTRAGFQSLTPSQLHNYVQGKAELPPRPVMITFDDGYADICDYALPVLERYGFGSAVFVVTSLLGATSSWDSGKYAPLPLMTRSAVREWSERGVEFGAHTRTHISLEHTDPEKRHREIAGSRDDLADLLGAKPLSFSYPWGTHDDSVVETVRSYFPLALTIRDGLNTRTTDPHRLLRTVVRRTDNVLDVVARARFGTSPLYRARARLERMRRRRQR